MPGLANAHSLHNKRNICGVPRNKTQFQCAGFIISIMTVVYASYNKNDNSKWNCLLIGLRFPSYREINFNFDGFSYYYNFILKNSKIFHFKLRKINNDIAALIFILKNRNFCSVINFSNLITTLLRLFVLKMHIRV